MTLPSGTSSTSLFYFIQTLLTSSWSNKPPSTSTTLTPYQPHNNPYSSIMELLFTQFGKLLLPTQVTQDKTNNLNPITSQTTYERQKKPEIISCYTPTFIDALTHSFDVYQSMQFKTCHQAILCVRMLLAIDTKLKVFVTDEYLSLLQQIETMHWKTDSFGSKHVIVIEGLSGSGKTEILEKILTQSSQVNTIRSWKTHPQYLSLYKYVMTLPKPIQICFAFLDLYRIVYEIMTSTSQDIFVLEEYYHHFLVQYLLEQTYPGFQEESILSDVFAWPLDLPMPELVLYLTTSTTIRLERTQSKKPFASIPTNNHKDNEDDDDDVGIIKEEDEERVVEITSPSSPVPTTWPSSDEQDLLANNLYARICGPGTVGIDSSPSIDEVYQVVIEALDFYGVYCITRALPPSAPSSPQRPSLVDQISPFDGCDDDPIPMMPSDVISNRRISMGIYGMYSKM